jgi:hypothetical protein
MSEEIKKKGRQKGISYKNPTGYIVIKDNLRIRIETDCLIIEEIIGKEKTGENKWGNNKYFTSWDGLLSWIIRRFTTEKISQKELWSFVEAKKEIISAINEVKSTLIGEIDSQLKSAEEEIKENISKFNR